MTVRILVALDGSQLSEQVLPAARHFAGLVGSCTIELFEVVDPRHFSSAGSSDLLPPKQLSQEVKAGERYLRQRATTLESDGVECTCSVAVGPPIPAILERVDRGDVDYVFMATHGRSGLGRALLGSVTDAVTRQSAVPVVVVHPAVASRSQEVWSAEGKSTSDLIEALAREDAVAKRAREALRAQGSDVVPALVRALDDERATLRRHAAQTLGSMKAAVAAPDLVRKLRDDVFEVRWAASEALAHCGDRGISEVLAALIRDPVDAHMAGSALHVLRKTPLSLYAIVRPVIRSLQQGDRSIITPVVARTAREELAAVESGASAQHTLEPVGHGRGPSKGRQ